MAAVVSLACVAYPLYVIRPFRAQGARELAAALFVLRVGPWLSIECALGAVAAAVYAWRGVRGWKVRAAAVLCVLVAALGASVARLNPYEKLLFHAIGEPQFEAAERAHVDANDMVLVVRVNHASHAYPIREIAYHHVVNDTLGGEPIVATY